MIRFIPVTSEHIDRLATIADTIWHEYWPALIGPAQTDYMVEKFQSREAIQEDMHHHGYEYWFIAVQEEETPIELAQAHGAGGVNAPHTTPADAPDAIESDEDWKMSENAVNAARNLPQARIIGYTGGHIEPESNRFFISKIYLFDDARGKGHATQVIRFYTQLCRDRGLDAMYLTVNKGNALAIPAYEHLGFETIDAVETDIGNGFIMDDYIMEKSVRR